MHGDSPGAPAAVEAELARQAIVALLCWRWEAGSSVPVGPSFSCWTRRRPKSVPALRASLGQGKYSFFPRSSEPAWHPARRGSRAVRHVLHLQIKVATSSFETVRGTGRSFLRTKASQLGCNFFPANVPIPSSVLSLLPEPARPVGAAFFSESSKPCVSDRLGSSPFLRPALSPRSHASQGCPPVWAPSVLHRDRPGTSAAPSVLHHPGAHLPKGGAWCRAPCTLLPRHAAPPLMCSPAPTCSPAPYT